MSHQRWICWIGVCVCILFLSALGRSSSKGAFMSNTHKVVLLIMLLYCSLWEINFPLLYYLKFCYCSVNYLRNLIFERPIFIFILVISTNLLLGKKWAYFEPKSELYAARGRSFAVRLTHPSTTSFSHLPFLKHNYFSQETC